MLGLEVQRRHVVEDEGDIAAGKGVREADLSGAVTYRAVPLLLAPHEVSSLWQQALWVHLP